ncbi:hypothetical protein [Rhizobium sp. RCC_161_2]|uniref:hypothetical protein n=1 Tax=Rhizobium sp. RCC_161_2 TaxID=3239219 RepID=UPI00352333D2
MADSENSRTLPVITRRKENPERGTAENLPHIIDCETAPKIHPFRTTSNLLSSNSNFSGLRGQRQQLVDPSQCLNFLSASKWLW